MNNLSQPPQPTEPDMALLYFGSLFETLDYTRPPERDEATLDALAWHILDKRPKTLLGLAIRARAKKYLCRYLWTVDFEKLPPSDQAARVVIECAMLLSSRPCDRGEFRAQSKTPPHTSSIRSDGPKRREPNRQGIAMLKVLAQTCLVFVLSSGPAAAQHPSSRVTIGVLNDQSGIYADVGGMGSIWAARMAVEDFGGTVLGRDIAIVAADHKNDPQRAVQIATAWFDNEGVTAIVELTNSAIALAVQKLAKDRSRITIASLAGSTELTGSACSPTGFQWSFDNYSNSVGLARELVSFHQDTWFFITADYAFGWSLEHEAGQAVIQAGGRVLGSSRHPLNERNFGPHLSLAQDSNAKVIALANAGGDTVETIRQAAEIGISPRTQTLVPMLVFISDVHKLGLDLTKGMTFVDGFYWDLDADTRSWSKRFQARQHTMPTMGHAGTYSAVLHYLRAVAAAGTDEALAVASKMREIPVNDFFARNGRARLDGRMVHDMYLVQVKYPDESSATWDYYKLVSTIPGEKAFRPIEQSECPMVKR